MRHDRLIAAALVCMAALVVTACDALRPPNGPYSATIEPGLSPRLSPNDAVRITLDYLDAQTPEIASPDQHIPSHVDSVVALEAMDAASLDVCIPAETSSDIVWVTKATGDYLNLSEHPWSSRSVGDGDPMTLACTGPGPAGMLVIDDATGNILGVFPSDPCCPRPSR